MRTLFIPHILNLVMILTLTACAAADDSRGMTSFDYVQTAYERAIRWGDFQAAIAMHKPPMNEISDKELKNLKSIRVTSYRLVFRDVNVKNNEARQTVTIKYYDEEYAIERSMTVKQHFVYEKKTDSWLLDSEFPKFK